MTYLKLLLKKSSNISDIKLWLFISISPLLLAYTSQYYFNLPPCELCIYQRIPYWLIILISLCSLKYKNKKIIRVLVLLAMYFSIFISGFHFGVEEGWINYSSTCSNNYDKISNFEEYKVMIEKASLVSCNAVMAKFLGISMACWNFLYSLFVTLFIRLKPLSPN